MDLGCNPGTRVCTIVTSSAYIITDAVTIDGYTQTNTSPNTLAVGTNAVIRIRLVPANSSVSTGLLIQASDVTIRGLAIGGYPGWGILIDSRLRTRIVGCFIGVNPNGTQAFGNGTGILFENVGAASGAIVGGPNPADRNLISGNGLAIQVLDSQGVTIMGNAIGTNAAGTAGIPNGDGILLRSNSNLVGGTGPGEGNVIAYNGGMAVRVSPGVVNAAFSNRILGNAIFANGGPGIDLGGNGVTPNDSGDGDTGPNNLQNFPVLINVGVRVNTTVHGTLNSTANRQFRIELFSNAACDPDGNGEGETFLGAVNTTTDGTGNASFVGIFPPVPAGRFITATATDPDGNTSEFSACLMARQASLNISSLTATTTEANDSSIDWQIFTSLTSVPTANVTFPLSITDPTEGKNLGASTITFTPTDAISNHVIALVGVDDGIDDGNVPYTVVLGPASSTDPNYNGLDPPDVAATNIDDDNQAAQCGPRPRVTISVVKIGSQQLRATVAVTTNPGTQNEIQSIRWDRLDTVTVVLDGVGPVQQGQTTTFATPLTQSATFVITRTPGAQFGTVRLIVKDACGDWPTFVGGGPNAW